MMWIVVLLSLLMADRANAQQVGKEYLELSRAMFGGPQDAKWRANYARKLNAYCTYLIAKSPRNTPAEDTWVITEMSDALLGPGASDARLTRFENSIENARYILQTTFQRCADTTKEIALFKDVRGSKQEAVLWSRLGHELSDAEHVQKAAIRTGMYSTQPAYSDPDGFASFNTIVQIILRDVIPSVLTE